MLLKVTIHVAISPAVLDRHVLPLDPAKLAQPLPERFHHTRLSGWILVPEEADANYFPGRLCQGGQRPEKRGNDAAAEEMASFAHP